MLTVKRGMVQLMVQALPCSMEVINSCEALKQDSALGITVAIYPLGYERFLGPELEGPVPTLFSDEPSKAQRAFMKSPQFAYNCLQALVKSQKREPNHHWLFLKV